ncbi:MAG: hypothetical protein ABFD76_15180 [Smithella sp.]
MAALPYSNMILENRVAFLAKVEEIAHRLRINPAWLMVVFYIETAASKYGRIDHRVTNALGAVGLIQFMPRTIRSLGTTAMALKLMSNVQQLDYVFRYLSPYSGRMNSLTDLYLAVFFPLAIGKPENWILQAAGLSASTVACWNPLYDLNRDKQLTVGEVKSKLKTFIPNGYVL